MKEYIERELVLAEAEQNGFVFVVPVSKIRNLPAADVVERRRGEWALDDVEMERYCSLCGHNAPIGMSSYILHNFCPNCGADMRGADHA